MTPDEQDAVAEFVSHAQSTLNDNLSEIWLFGSAVRDDRWSDKQQMRSDIDVLVIARTEASKEDQQVLVDATYPLFLDVRLHDLTALPLS